MQRCLFCSGDASAPDHGKQCCGRQGQIEADAAAAADLPTFEPFEHARTSDPETSLAAARMVDASEVQQRVFAIFRAHADDGLTDEELLALYAREWPSARSLESRSSPRKRRSDLARAGILVDTGNRRQLSSGRNGVVWSLAPASVHKVAS